MRQEETVCAKPLSEPSHSVSNSSNQEDVLNETEPSTRRGWKEKLFACYGIVVLFCIIALPRLGGTILSYFTDELRRDVGTTVSQYSIIAGHLNGFISAFFALFWGYCIDRLKWRRTWLLSALLVLLSGMHVLQGLARNFGDLLAATVFIAVGASVHMPLAISLISDLLPARLSLMGQALVFAGESFAIILGGNIASMLKLRGISWRDSEFGIAIAFLTLAVCTFLLPEPPSRQYHVASEGCERAPRFTFGAALKYLAGMKSYWILVLGLGVWAAASEIVFSYMPAFQEAQFPGATKLSGDIGTVLGACALASALLFGAISLRASKLRSRTLSLASAAGALLGCLFFILALYANALAGPQHGYVLMLVCLGLGAVSAQGLIGPMNGELAATLPAHMKNFGLSLYIFFQNLLQPCYVAIMGVGLQSLHENHKTATVASHAKLKAKSETILSSFGAARTFLTFGLAFNLCLAAILFVAASFNIKKDIRGRMSSNANLQQTTKLSVPRVVGLVMFIASFLVFAIALLALTLYSSFHSEGVFTRTR